MQSMLPIQKERYGCTRKHSKEGYQTFIQRQAKSPRFAHTGLSKDTGDMLETYKILRSRATDNRRTFLTTCVLKTFQYCSSQ